MQISTHPTSSTIEFPYVRQFVGYAAVAAVAVSLIVALFLLGSNLLGGSGDSSVEVDRIESDEATFEATPVDPADIVVDLSQGVPAEVPAGVEVFENASADPTVLIDPLVIER